VLMRGAKPWGYFGLSAAAGVSAPYSFMLVSGGPAVREQCVVSSGHGLNAEPCLDAIVAGDGRDVFTFTSEGSLQTASGYCVRLAGDKLELEKCDSSTGVWEVSADGQVKQGNMCLAVDGSAVHALDCDEAASLGASNFFQVAVPAYDPKAVVAVRSLGELLRGSLARQGKLLKELQESLAGKVGEHFGVSQHELSSTAAASAEALAAFRKGTIRCHGWKTVLVQRWVRRLGKGSFTARRHLLGVNLHWSYAPAEVKVLMRGAKPWGYFGLSAAAGVSAPYSFMLVSGGPAVREQCVVSSGHGLTAEPCLDAIVAGDGRDVFTFTSEGSLQTASGYCVRLAGDKLELEKCDSSTGVWEVSADGQVKQGNMCLAVDGSAVHALDCDEAASLGASNFFQVAVPAYDPKAVVAVRSLGELLRGSLARQGKLLKELQESLAGKVGEHFGVSQHELSSTAAASAEALAAFRKGTIRCHGWKTVMGSDGPEDLEKAGSFTARRHLLGVNLHWSYAPAEVKVLMRGAKPWGYFGLSAAAGVSAPYSFMLVSGGPAVREQCVVSSGHGLNAEPCLDAIVAGDGRDVFTFTSEGSLQTASGYCVRLAGDKLELEKCDSSTGVWEVSADGQVKQGNMCLAVDGSAVHALDCDEAASLGASNFFQVAVPAYDPKAVVAVRSLGELLRGSLARQGKLLKELQESLAGKVGEHFGVSQHELSSTAAASAEALAAFRKVLGQPGVKNSGNFSYLNFVRFRALTLGIGALGSGGKAEGGKDRRHLLGVNLHWSYAPAEVKVLMRGAKPWGYFGLSAAAGVSAPYSFMLVSGGPAVREQCVVSSGHGLNAEPCLDAIVAGDGRDVFTFTSEGSLQTASGYCVRLAGDKLELEKCDSSTGVWEVSADGQVKQGNMCLAVDGSAVHALDCDEAASLGASNFFQVAVPAYDPKAVVAVRSLGELLRGSLARQGKLLKELQALLPKLATCKAKISLASLPNRIGPAWCQVALIQLRIGIFGMTPCCQPEGTIRCPGWKTVLVQCWVRRLGKGTFTARRHLLGVNLHWSYAPAEVKVLMRGAKPWGYFGLSAAAGVSAPYSFMLVSGGPAVREQCVVSSGIGPAWCQVALIQLRIGIFGMTPCCQPEGTIRCHGWKTVLVQCWVRRLGKGRFCNHIALRMNVWQEAWPERNCFLAGDKLELEKCDSSTGVWEVSADGQVKQGNMCLAVDGSAVHALDCDEAASLGASNFFQVAVPAYDPKAVVAVRSLGELLRGSLARQGKLLKELQALRQVRRAPYLPVGTGLPRPPARLCLPSVRKSALVGTTDSKDDPIEARARADTLPVRLASGKLGVQLVGTARASEDQERARLAGIWAGFARTLASSSASACDFSSTSAMSLRQLFLDRAPSTLRRHLSGWRLWVAFCSIHDLQPVAPPISALLDFLESLSVGALEDRGNARQRNALGVLSAMTFAAAKLSLESLQTLLREPMIQSWKKGDKWKRSTVKEAVLDSGWRLPLQRGVGCLVHERAGQESDTESDSSGSSSSSAALGDLDNQSDGGSENSLSDAVELEGPWLLNALSGVAHKAIHVDGDEDTVFLACRPSATLHAAFGKRLENPWFEERLAVLGRDYLGVGSGPRPGLPESG
ncbi:unnamed protein product, partial [Cladocopium goreaui]